MSKERMKQLCRYVGKQAVNCAKCPIPKYRKRRYSWLKCPAARLERACSSELIDYFVGGE